MKFLLPTLGLLTLGTAITTNVTSNATTMEELVSKYKAEQMKILASRQEGCTQENVGIRREWGAMSKPDRKAYIDAVLCLQSKPSISPPGLVPGARSRFDDFQAIHINQTFTIHFNARLLPWHRYFEWTYEQALRNECGYKGYQPYWDWSLYSDDPASSPLFDGSAYSLSGNGEAIPHDAFAFTIARTNIPVSIPPGTGGGCIQGGPFANMTVNLGPVNSSGSLPGFVGDGSGFDYNPRCLTRDLTTYFSRPNLNTQQVADDISLSADFDAFTVTLGAPGLHSAGHWTIGGLNDDEFASNGDPAFYFHHAQVDHVWAIWQNQDLANRQYQLTGSVNWFNIPPGPNITLDNPFDMGFLGVPTIPARDIMSTIDGPFCYIYE